MSDWFLNASVAIIALSLPTGWKQQSKCNVFSFLLLSDLWSSNPLTFFSGKDWAKKDIALAFVLATLNLLTSSSLEYPIKIWFLKIVTSPPSIITSDGILRTFSNFILEITSIIAGNSCSLFSIILEIKKKFSITKPKSLAKTWFIPVTFLGLSTSIPCLINKL